MTGQFPTFREWACNHSVGDRVCAAAQKIGTAEPVYKRITNAARSLGALSPSDFPVSLQPDVKIIFSVFDYLKFYDDHTDGSGIPNKLKSRWIPALMRVHEHLIIAKGRYDDIEDRAQD
jgi:hypothetical protein